jgi:hypothetical protein
MMSIQQLLVKFVMLCKNHLHELYIICNRQNLETSGIYLDGTSVAYRLKKSVIQLGGKS